MNVDTLQYKTINWLRLPLVVFVVVSHCAFLDAWEMIDHISQIDSLRLSGKDLYIIVGFILSYVLPSIVVPCFFLIAGFMFFYRMKEWSRRFYLTRIKRRISSQAVPYILWNVVAVVIVGAFFFIRRDGSFATWMDELREQGILRVFWNYEFFEEHCNIFGNPVPAYYPYNGPLWFMRDLFMLVLLSPAVYYFVRYTKLLGVVVLGICYCTQLWIYTPGFGIEAMFFFSLGAYFSIMGRNMIAELRKGWLVWLLITLICAVISLYHGTSQGVRQLFVFLYTITGTITIINLASGGIESGWIKTGGAFVKFMFQTSFFIYVSHNILIMTKLPYIFVDFIFPSNSTFFLMVKFLTMPIFCIGICVGLFYVAGKITPKLLKSLMGR